ncbi:MAG TPA: hypothetical protein PK530_02185 [Anaerolineales bacterium]|nr:hypothetical protein [Anaerolineales bacterium]
MAAKKSQPSKKAEKRMRTQQIVVVVFSIFVILSMVVPMFLKR